MIEPIDHEANLLEIIEHLEYLAAHPYNARQPTAALYVARLLETLLAANASIFVDRAAATEWPLVELPADHDRAAAGFFHFPEETTAS
jgi:hypothetical protein